MCNGWGCIELGKCAVVSIGMVALAREASGTGGLVAFMKGTHDPP